MDAEAVVDALDEWLAARANFDSLNRVDRETYEDRERLREARKQLIAALDPSPNQDGKVSK